MNSLKEGNLESILDKLTEKDIKRIMRLSASKIGIWEKCPMAFFQKYIVHEKIPEHVRLVFGKSIHYYLDKFYKMDFKSPESFANQWAWYWRRNISGEGIRDKRVLKSLKVRRYPTFKQVPVNLENPTGDEGFMEIGNHITFGNFIDEDRNFSKKGKLTIRHQKVDILWGYNSLGKAILKRFYKRHKGREPPIYREKRKTLNLFGHETIVIFDRIDRWPNGNWTITDYKTNRWPPKGGDIHRNVQFTLYSYSARKIFGEEFGGDETAIYYYHLRTGKFFETHRSKNDFVYLEHLLDSVSRGIEDALKTGNFIPHYDYRCGSCDFGVPCDKYSPFYGGPKIVREGRIEQPRSFRSWEDLEEAHSLNDDSKEFE